MGLDTQGVCGVDKDAGMLGRHDGFDDSGQIVDIRKRLDAEQDVVERGSPASSIFRGTND